MKNMKLSEGRRMWVQFIILTLLMGLFVALISGSLQIRRNIRAGVSLEDFRAHMDKPYP